MCSLLQLRGKNLTAPVSSLGKTLIHPYCQIFRFDWKIPPASIEAVPSSLENAALVSAGRCLCSSARWTHRKAPARCVPAHGDPSRSGAVRRDRPGTSPGCAAQCCCLGEGKVLRRVPEEVHSSLVSLLATKVALRCTGLKESMENISKKIQTLFLVVGLQEVFKCFYF